MVALIEPSVTLKVSKKTNKNRDERTKNKKTRKQENKKQRKDHEHSPKSTLTTVDDLAIFN
jgi:hypothetical protein